MTVRRDHLDALAMGLMVLFCATWGLNQVGAKVANASISPVLQAGLRSVCAGVLVWAWCTIRGVPLFQRDGSFWPGLLAGLLFAAEFAAMYVGLQFTAVSRGILFLYTAPFFVALGLHWLVPAERLRLIQAAGLICAFIGIGVAFSEHRGVAGDREWLGNLILLAAAAFWGLTTVVVRASVLARISPGKTLFYQLAVSAIVLPPASWLMGEPGFTNPTPVGLAAFASQVVCVAFASYLGWFWLVARYPATRLAAFSFLAPLFGIIFGAVLLGEPISAQLLIAFALVAAGLWLVNRRARIAI